MFIERTQRISNARHKNVANLDKKNTLEAFS